MDALITEMYILNNSVDIKWNDFQIDFALNRDKIEIW